MDKLEKFLNKFLGPVANWMSNSKFFSALSEAFMRITPVTLGTAVLLIIGNFPIPAWIRFLEKTGLSVQFNAVIGASTGALSLFIAFNFAYVYARNAKKDALTAGLLSLTSFLILLPQQMKVPTLKEEITKFPAKAVVTAIETKDVFEQTWTGGMGILVAILVGYVTARLYIFFLNKNIVVKLPASVPPNVSESLSPSILSGLIFGVFFIVRLLFSFTPFQNIFFFAFGVIQAPLQSLTGSPVTIIFIFTLANVLWFFGIHPNMVYGAVLPLITANGVANINAFRDGQPLPYLLMAVIATVCSNGFGGQGGTIGLVVSMFTAKSQRYKELLKLGGPPSIFNINEPLIFGMPIMMNPFFFIPMLLNPILMGAAAWIMVKILNFSALNPLIKLPWTTPAPVVMALQGGFKYFLIFLVCFIINVLVWFPFFRLADKKEYAVEQGMANE